MLAANVVVGLQVVAVILGLLASYAVIFWGLPDAVRLQDRPQSLARFHSQLPRIMANLAALLGGSWAFMALFSRFFSLERPVWWVLLLQCLFVFAFDDLWFYIIHRWMHRNKEVYRRVHRIHHEAYAPLPLHYIYVHPFELALGTVGMVVPLGIIGLLSGALPVWTLAICGSLRQLHELDIHSGVRGTLFRWVPLLAPADHHDLHHARPNSGNYGSMTLIWDRVLGTISKERAD